MAALPAQMTAIGIKASGGPDMLVPEKHPVPVPGDGEILVKVAAAGVNRPDVMQRMGLYPPPPGAPDIPGLEIAGEVVALGPNVKRWKLGDRVMALVVGGGYAEYCLAHESHALPVGNLSMVEAAAIPETFFTVWHNTFERGGLKRGETLLIHGGSSGIGTAAIQLAKAFGAHVITTAGSAEKCDACRKLGADVAVNYRTEDFVAATKTATGDKGAEVIVDMVGGDYIAQLRSRGGGRAHRADRVSGKSKVDGRFSTHHAQAAAPYRLDLAFAVDTRQRRHRAGGRNQCFAPYRRW